MEAAEAHSGILAAMEADLAGDLDSVALARRAGIEPDLWQVHALRSTANRALFNCSRQSGKSTMAATRAVHTALYQSGSLVLILCPALRQSQEVFRKCVEVFDSAGRPIPAEQETALTLNLANGSRIVSLPGSERTVRGYSAVSHLIVDEAARVEDELYFSITPMLAVSGGALWMLSTPYGKRGVFFEEWSEGSGWERYEVPATEVPRITPEFLEQERVTLGPWRFRQEYLCEFTETEEALFSYEDVQSAITDNVQPFLPAGGY